MKNMNAKGFGFLLLMVFCFLGLARAQSNAAMQKVQDRYDATQLADLQANTHYKYVGMLLYYSSSFLVVTL